MIRQDLLVEYDRARRVFVVRAPEAPDAPETVTEEQVARGFYGNSRADWWERRQVILAAGGDDPGEFPAEWRDVDPERKAAIAREIVSKRLARAAS